jgi:hypothetical protein
MGDLTIKKSGSPDEVRQFAAHGHAHVIDSWASPSYWAPSSLAGPGQETSSRSRRPIAARPRIFSKSVSA